jgi:hypothetical protein
MPRLNTPRHETAFDVAALTARYLQPMIAADLQRKMVFLGGPRQVGKTSLARALLPDRAAGLSGDSARIDFGSGQT